ncbi:hypothetical protein ACFWVU_01235 [Streptomyces sp. NPDC058686]|uniref:hypothetical protein n=1 Tax=Streptomyces sp. NPDC058686 TaxID=3346599 RepID=UPI003662B84D
MPPHDRVRAYQQQELAQLVHRELVEQAGEDSAVGVGERGLGDLALQDEQLVPQGEGLDVFIVVAHWQET